MPLIGFLAIMAGGGMLYSARKFSELLAIYGTYGRIVCGGIGVVVLLWGLWMVATRFASRGGRRAGALNRNRVMLPREGMMYLLIMIVAFVASLIGRSNMLMLVFSIMAGPFILNGWVTFSLLKRNKLTRRLPDRAFAGEVFSVDVTLENRKLWFSSWLMAVRDHIAWRGDMKRRIGDGESLEPAVLFASVRPGTKRTACYQLRLTRRGTYALGPLEMSTRFPIGIVERGFVTDVCDTLIVHPQIGILSPAWHNDPLNAAEQVQHRQTRRGMFEDEFHHLRDYRSGDNPRNIHWRTSARINHLTVREFQQARDQTLIVVLDLWTPPRPSTEHNDRVELAVSFAATICIDHMKQTRGVDQQLFVSGTSNARVQANSGDVAIRALLDTLATAEAGNGNGLNEIVNQAAGVVTALSRTIVITTRPDDKENGFGVKFQELAGAELYRADPDTLSRWFTLEDGLESPDSSLPVVENAHAEQGAVTV